MREITLKIKADEKEALASVARLSKAISNLNTSKSLGLSGGGAGLQNSANQFRQSNQIGFDLKAFKQQLAEVEKLTARQSRFAAIEYKNQTKIAELESRNRIQAARLESSAIEAAKRREFSEFQRLEREKTKASQKSTSGGGGFGSSLFSTVFGAATAAGLAVNVIGAAVNEVKQLASEIVGLGVTSVKLAADFQGTVNSLTVFTGSTRLAREEIAAIDEVSRNTVGLRLQTAEEGYTRLRALGFQADLSRKLVAGLAKEKLISNSTEQDINRVIVNLIQLSAGSARASQDIKEIIHAVPSLRGAFEDAFGTADPKKLKAFIDADPAKAFEKLADAMAKVQTPAGGLNNAIDKLTDSAIEAGRAFGEPLVQPLTDLFTDLKKYLDENRNQWKDWGEYVGDIIRGLSADAKQLSGVNAPPIPTRKNGDGQIVPDRGFLGNGLADVGNGLGQLFNLLTNPKHNSTGALVKTLSGEAAAERGAEIRNAETDRKRQQYQSAGVQLLRQQEDKSFSPEALKAREAAEKEAKRLAQTATDKELALLRSSADEANTILKNRFDVEQAIRDSSIRYTAEQEKSFAAGSGAANARYLQSEIARQTGFYDKQIAALGDNDEEVKKLQSDKVVKLSNLNKDYQLNEINTQKQVREFERRILDERRNAFIEFKQFAVRQSKFSFDNRNFDIFRGISDGTLSAGKAFDDLINLTQKSYEEISQLTKESFALQLQNQSLTVEQRSNLIKQGYFEEKQLAEENRRTIIDIEEKKRQKQIQTIEKFYQQTRDIQGIQSDNATNIFKDLLGGGASQSEFTTQLDRIKNAITTYSKLNKTISDATSDRNKIDVGNIGQQNGLSDRILTNNGLRDITNKTVEQQKEYEANEILINAQSKIRADLEETISKTIRERADFLSANSDIYGLEQTSGLVLLLKTLDLTKLESYVEIQKELAALPYKKDFFSLQSQIEENARLQSSAAPTELIDLQAKASALTAQFQAVGLAWGSAKREIENTSSAGIQKYIDDLPKNAFEKLRIVASANDEFFQNAKSLVQENIALESRYYENSEVLAIRRKNTLLNANREIYEAEQNAILSQIESQVKLAHQTDVSVNQIRAQVLGHLAQQKSLSDGIAEGINNVYDAITNKLDSNIDKATKKLGIFGTLINAPLKAIEHNFVSNITSNLLDKFLPAGFADSLKSTGNPQLDAANKSAKHLESIDSKLGGFGGLSAIGGKLAGSSSGSSSGGLLGLISKFFGGGSNGSQGSSGGGGLGSLFGGSAGGGIFNFGGGSSPSSSSSGGTLTALLGGVTGRGQSRASGAGNLSAGNVNLASIFGGGGGAAAGGAGSQSPLSGLFSAQGISSAIASGGITAAIALAQIALTTHNPLVGLATGGLIGLGFGFLNRARRRKREEKLRNEFLQTGIAGLSGFDTLISDLRALRIDSASAITQGTALGQTLRQNYLTQAATLKDKKTRNIALSSVSELDFKIRQKMDELRSFADYANAAADRKTRILPEFAGGAYMDRAFMAQFVNFKRRNGLLAGTFTGRDTLPSMLAPGEMVLNPAQQARVRASAGHDVFRPANIPGYADGVFLAPIERRQFYGSPRPQQPPETPNVVLQPQFTLYLNGDTFSESATAYMESEQGERTTVKVINKAKLNNRVT